MTSGFYSIRNTIRHPYPFTYYRHVQTSEVVEGGVFQTLTTNVKTTRRGTKTEGLVRVI